MARVVLIGPIGAGKGTVAQLLSERTGLRNVPLDRVRWGYYYRAGYDRLKERARVRAGGELAKFAYWKPFEADAVERAVRDFPDAIIDFGAGHSVHDDPALFERARSALALVAHVVLLLPSPDPEASLRVLEERARPLPERAEAFAALNRGFVESPCNARLATLTVHTDGRTPEETRDDVLRGIGWA